MERDTTTIRDYLRIIFKRKMLMVVAIIPMVLINFVTNEFKTQTYTASVRMLIKIKALAPTVTEQYQNILGTDIMMRSHFDLVKSKNVIEPVVKVLKLYELLPTREMDYATPIKKMWLKYIYKKMDLREMKTLPQEVLIERALSQWRGKIEVSGQERTSVFMISVTDYDPSLAARVANAISRSYLIYDLEQQIAELELKYGDKHSTIVQKRDMIQKLTDTLDKEVVPDLETIPTSIKILQEAELTSSSETSRAMVLIFPVFAGILLGITLIIVLDYFNQTVKSPKDVGDVIHADLLGSVPKIKSENKFINSQKINSDYVSAYKQLSDNIYMKMKDQQLKSVLITDCDDSKDTPYIIANIAMYLSHYEGHKVLIVDLNLRAPLLSETFNISSNGNLIDLLEEKISFEDAVRDLGSNLHIMPASKPEINPIGFFNSNKLKDLINGVRDNYDLILISCADLQNYKDAIMLSSYTDSTIVVMNEGKTHKRVAKYVLKPFQEKKINLIGVILNDRTYDIPNIIYKLT